MLNRLLLGLLVAWAAAGFLSELSRAVAGWDDRAQATAPPQQWRFGMPAPNELERCLAPARRTIPPHRTVGFLSPDEPRGAAVYRAMWAAYLMPAHDVMPVGDAAAAKLAEYAVACGTAADLPWLVPLRDLPGGRLYRVRRR